MKRLPVLGAALGALSLVTSFLSVLPASAAFPVIQSLTFSQDVDTATIILSPQSTIDFSQELRYAVYSGNTFKMGGTAALNSTTITVSNFRMRFDSQGGSGTYRVDFAICPVGNNSSATWIDASCSSFVSSIVQYSSSNGGNQNQATISDSGLSSLTRGGNATYVVTVRNTGNSTITALVVHDVNTSSWLTFQPNASSTFCNNAEECTISSLAPGASTQIVLSFAVSQNIPCGSTITHQVMMSGGGIGSQWSSPQTSTVFCGSSSSSSFSTSSRMMPPAGYEDTVLTNIDVYQNPFPDTDIHTLLGKAAAELYRRAVIGGFPDGEFKGSRLVNRAEAAKFLLLARFGTVADVRNNGQFPDVLDNQWYTKFIVTASQRGIINGYPDGLFRPADAVNTAEFLKMMSLTFGVPLNLPYHYTDVQQGSWYAPYAGIAERYNLFPDRTTQLMPDRQLTRGEVAIAIYQYLSQR